MSSFTLDKTPLSTDPDVLALADQIRDSGEINPLISEEIKYIVDTAMQVDPDERYDEACAIAAALMWIQMDIAA